MKIALRVMPEAEAWASATTPPNGARASMGAMSVERSEAAGSATTPTQSTEAGATQAKQGWADVDTNADGNISKEEAAANPGLSQVFDQADANTDGSLTADEYKAFVSKNYGEQK